MERIKLIIQYIPSLLGSLPLTLLLLLVSVLIGMVIGMLLVMVRLGKHKVLKALAGVYISFMRGTPLIIQIFLVFFGFPMILESFGVNTNALSGTFYAIIAFGLNEAAFFSEIFRSAYLAINKGQMEAAMSLGMTRVQVFTRVIWPQGLVSALPNTTNMIIELMKNTSLAVSIGVVDMMGKANQIAQASFGVGQLEVLFAVSLLYWMISTVMTRLSNYTINQLGQRQKGNSGANKKLMTMVSK